MSKQQANRQHGQAVHRTRPLVAAAGVPGPSGLHRRDGDGYHTRWGRSAHIVTGGRLSIGFNPNFDRPAFLIVEY